MYLSLLTLLILVSITKLPNFISLNKIGSKSLGILLKDTSFFSLKCFFKESSKLSVTHLTIFSYFILKACGIMASRLVE